MNQQLLPKEHFRSIFEGSEDGVPVNRSKNKHPVEEFHAKLMEGAITS